MDRVRFIELLLKEAEASRLALVESGRIGRAALDQALLRERERLSKMNDVQLMGLWELSPEARGFDPLSEERG